VHPDAGVAEQVAAVQRQLALEEPPLAVLVPFLHTERAPNGPARHVARACDRQRADPRVSPRHHLELRPSEARHPIHGVAAEDLRKRIATVAQGRGDGVGRVVESETVEGPPLPEGKAPHQTLRRHDRVHAGHYNGIQDDRWTLEDPERDPDRPPPPSPTPPGRPEDDRVHAGLEVAEASIEELDPEDVAAELGLVEGLPFAAAEHGEQEEPARPAGADRDAQRIVIHGPVALERHLRDGAFAFQRLLRDEPARGKRGEDESGFRGSAHCMTFVHLAQPVNRLPMFDI